MDDEKRRICVPPVILLRIKMCSTSVISFFSHWRLWIRPFLIALYILLIIVLVPILIAHSINNGFKKSDQGALVGGGFVLLAVPISVWQIIQHIVHYTKPSLQKHIIRYVIFYYFTIYISERFKYTQFSYAVFAIK